jgi:hypothetical protein
MRRFHKSVDGKDGAPKPLVAQQHRGRTVLIWIERILLVSGLMLVTFYAAMRLESWFASRAALKQFARANVRSHSGSWQSASPASLELHGAFTHFDPFDMARFRSC